MENPFAITTAEKAEELYTSLDLIQDLNLLTPDLVLEIEKIQAEIAELEKAVLSRKVQNKLERFSKKNKRNAVTYEAVLRWKLENNIKYDPNEVYSRGHHFYHVTGFAMNDFDHAEFLDAILRNLAFVDAVGEEIILSCFTREPQDRRKKLEKGTNIRMVIFPKPSDIMWASFQDVRSPGVLNATKNPNKLPISFTKSPSNQELDNITPNLADAVDQYTGDHNELGIHVRLGNFLFECDDDVPDSIKEKVLQLNKQLQNAVELPDFSSFDQGGPILPKVTNENIPISLPEMHKRVLHDRDFDSNQKTATYRRMLIFQALNLYNKDY